MLLLWALGLLALSDTTCLSVKGERNKLLIPFQHWERKDGSDLMGKAPKHPSGNADSAPGIAGVLSSREAIRSAGPGPMAAGTWWLASLSARAVQHLGTVTRKWAGTGICHWEKRAEVFPLLLNSCQCCDFFTLGDVWHPDVSQTSLPCGTVFSPVCIRQLMPEYSALLFLQ